MVGTQCAAVKTNLKSIPHSSLCRRLLLLMAFVFHLTQSCLHVGAQVSILAHGPLACSVSHRALHSWRKVCLPVRNEDCPALMNQPGLRGWCTGNRSAWQRSFHSTETFPQLQTGRQQDQGCNVASGLLVHTNFSATAVEANRTRQMCSAKTTSL